MSVQVLVSNAVPDMPQIRQPLEYVILPAGTFSPEECLPQQHVWWVEQYGRRLYLRSKLMANRATLERALATERRMVKWHLSANSERISWPSTRATQADATDLLASYIPPSTGLTLLSIDSDLDTNLEYRRLHAAELSRNYEWAHRQFRHHERRTRESRPPFSSAKKGFSHALSYVHNYFSRVELLRVGEYNPYYVAAAALLDFEELVEHPVEELLRSRLSPFQELDGANLAYTECDWNFRGDLTQPDKQNLATSTRQHQEILRQLIQKLKQVGCQPTYNRHVDLCVEREDTVVFFEIKSTRAENYEQQVRRAVGQLLEYRFRYLEYFAPKPIELVAVVETCNSPGPISFAQSFLSSVGITFVDWPTHDGNLPSMRLADLLKHL